MTRIDIGICLINETFIQITLNSQVETRFNPEFFPEIMRKFKSGHEYQVLNAVVEYPVAVAFDPVWRITLCSKRTHQLKMILQCVGLGIHHHGNVQHQ